jgi:hypothetical protein
LHRVAEPRQPLGDERAGPLLLEAQLGVLVEIAPGGDKLGTIDRW